MANDADVVRILTENRPRPSLRSARNDTPLGLIAEPGKAQSATGLTSTVERPGPDLSTGFNTAAWGSKYVEPHGDMVFTGNEHLNNTMITHLRRPRWATFALI